MCEMREQAVTGKERPVKTKKLRKGLEPVSIVEDGGGNCKFARALGSVDWHTREQGLQALTTWLTRTTPTEADLTKIWKALFFCFWHSDKSHVQVSAHARQHNFCVQKWLLSEPRLNPLVMKQAELAERLAAILPMLSGEVSNKTQYSYQSPVRRVECRYGRCALLMPAYERVLMSLASCRDRCCTSKSLPRRCSGSGLESTSCVWTSS